MSSCDSTNKSTDGYFTTYYAINKIIFDYLEAKLDFKLESSFTDMFDKQHTKVPVYNLPNLNIKALDKYDNVLNQNYEDVFAELEEVLVHMVNDQDEELYRSDIEFFKNQKNFKTYMKNAAWWEKISYWSSLTGTALAAGIILVITVACCYKGRYIEGYVTYVMGKIPFDDGFVVVPKAKAFPTDRTFPPIFTMPTAGSDNPELHQDPGIVIMSSAITLICIALMGSSVYIQVLQGVQTPIGHLP